MWEKMLTKIELGKSLDMNGALEELGTCAELIALPEFQAAKIDESVDFKSAACMGIPASTAYYGILANGPVKDKTVLVSGGAGAVGFAEYN